MLSSPASSSRGCGTNGHSGTREALPVPAPGHFQLVAKQLVSLSGPSFRIPCGTEIPRELVGVAELEGVSVEGSGSASVKVWGNVPGCHESGREWRDRRRRERILLCVCVCVCVREGCVYVCACVYRTMNTGEMQHVILHKGGGGMFLVLFYMKINFN